MKNAYTVPAISGFLLLAVLVVFGQTIRHEFVNFDDDSYVYANPQVSHGLTVSGAVWAFTQSYRSNWIPLTWISLMVDGNLYGLHAGGYHLTNVLLHAATAILLFLVLRRMTGCLWPSAFAAALFAVHPLRAESVAWVTERKDVLSGLFFMLTLWAYVGYVRHRFSLARYALVIVLFALGLMAKPMLVTLPFVLLLLDYWPLRRMVFVPREDTLALGWTSHGRPESEAKGVGGTTITPTETLGGKALGRVSVLVRLVIEKIPLFVVAGGDCLLTLFVQDRSLVSTEHLPLWWRIGNAIIAYVTYLGQFFYPVGLSVLYPRPGLDLPLWKVFAAFLVLASITTAAFIGRRRCPYILVGWLWYLGMLVPVIGFLQVGTVSVADRFTYLTQIGLGIALAWGAADLCRSWPYRRWVCGVASASVLAVLMGCALRQTSFWRNSETLWTRALACNSQNAFAQGSLGMVLHQSGRIDEAAACYLKAIEIGPDEDAHNNLGGILADRGEIGEAIAHFQKALKINPDSASAHNNLGRILASRGRTDEAIAHLRKALETEPNSADTHSSLGKAFLRQGKPSETLIQWREAVRLQPTDIGNVSQLASLLATCPETSIRNGNEAVYLARWAVELSKGRKPTVLGTLAAAYAEAGQFSKAIEAAERAVALASTDGNVALTDTLRAQIKLYQAGSPYREILSQHGK